MNILAANSSFEKQDGQLKTAKFADSDEPASPEPVVLFATLANFAVLLVGPTFSQSLMAASTTSYPVENLRRVAVGNSLEILPLLLSLTFFAITFKTRAFGLHRGSVCRLPSK